MYNISGVSHCYDTILRLPHHVSPTRPQMSRLNRAAQFAAFDALDGYGAAIRETARLTEEYRELDESQKSALNRKLFLLLNHHGPQPEVQINYFRPDAKKTGGEYVQKIGHVKKVDAYAHAVIMHDKTTIPIEEICGIESNFFSNEYYI